MGDKRQQSFARHSQINIELLGVCRRMLFIGAVA